MVTTTRPPDLPPWPDSTEAVTTMSGSRPSREARGYNWAHRQTRRHWQHRILNGEHVTCWRCGQPITVHDDWHLGHDDNDRSITHGPEHARSCNLHAAGVKSARQRPSRYRQPEPHPGQALNDHTTSRPSPVFGEE